MTYDFKNPKHREILHLMGFSDATINNAIKASFSREAQVHEANFCSDEATITFSKKCFKQIQEYKPDQWNPYPTITPPKEGDYLVTVEEYGIQRTFRVGVDYFTSDIGWEFYSEEDPIKGIAFRALPEPYKPEPPKDMHPDAIAARRYMGEEE